MLRGICRFFRGLHFHDWSDWRGDGKVQARPGHVWLKRYCRHCGRTQWLEYDPTANLW